MIPGISNTLYPVNQLLRQQTERQALQAEQQAQALEQQAAAKRREARQAQQVARELDLQADESANRANLLQQNLAASERLGDSQQQLNDRLSNALQPQPAAANEPTAEPEQQQAIAAPAPLPTLRSFNAAALFSAIASQRSAGSGLSINLQI